LKGSFTKNDQLTASPYTDAFLYIPNVTLSVANQVLPALNTVKRWKRDGEEKQPWSYGVVDDQYRAWLEDMDRLAGEGKQETAGGNSTFGYITKDVRVPSHARSSMPITLI
jgi:hypothetical protein